MSHLHLDHHYHLPRMKEMGRVYWCHSIGALAISLAAIFVPIFLLSSGISLQAVLLFCITNYVLAGLFQYPVAKLFRYISPHHLLVLGSLFMAGFFFTLSTIDIRSENLPLFSFLFAAQHSIYWAAFHYVFGKARAHESGNKQVAGLDALIIAGTTAAPAVGGVIATSFGIHYTYSLSIALLLVAVLPMLSKNTGPATTSVKISKMQLKEIRPDLFANVCHGTSGAVESVIWPLFVFLIVASYVGVGILSSVIAIASVAVTLYVGKRAGERGEKEFIRRGMATYSGASLVRAIAQNAGHVFGLNLLSGVGRALFHTPFLNRYYTNSDNSMRLGYITLMESFHSLGVVLLLGSVYLLLFVFSAKAALGIALAVVSLTILGIRKIR